MSVDQYWVELLFLSAKEARWEHDKLRLGQKNKSCCYEVCCNIAQMIKKGRVLDAHIFWIMDVDNQQLMQHACSKIQSTHSLHNLVPYSRRKHPRGWFTFSICCALCLKRTFQQFTLCLLGNALGLIYPALWCTLRLHYLVAYPWKK